MCTHTHADMHVCTHKHVINTQAHPHIRGHAHIQHTCARPYACTCSPRHVLAHAHIRVCTHRVPGQAGPGPQEARGPRTARGAPPGLQRHCADALPGPAAADRHPAGPGRAPAAGPRDRALRRPRPPSAPTAHGPPFSPEGTKTPPNKETEGRAEAVLLCSPRCAKPGLPTHPDDPPQK